jgi:hypothetical protein
VGYLLRNAFIEALRPSLAHSVGFQDVTGGKKTGITATDAKQAEKKADSEKTK